MAHLGELLLSGQQGVLFLLVLPLAGHQVFPLPTGCLPKQHQLLLASLLEFMAQLLMAVHLPAVPLDPLAAAPEFRLHNMAALLMLPHIRELAATLLNALVKQRHTRQFVNDFSTFTVTHGHNAGDIPLHHHVAAGGKALMTLQARVTA